MNTTTPTRIQLSRAKGWRMPENTVKVDRTSAWGNPFIVGKHGTAEECVHLFRALIWGYLVLSRGRELVQAQNAWLKHYDNGRALQQLRGKNLACWCRAGKPCHADLLLELANATQQGLTL